MAQEVEQWRPVVGFERFYEVSDLARVRRIETGRILSAIRMRSGYLYVTMSMPGVRTNKYRLHVVVANAFVSRPSPEFQVNHIDGNKLNCRLNNLEFVTHRQNMHHASNLGLLPRGQDRKDSKIGEAEVRQMFELRKQGMQLRQIAVRFGVCHRTVFEVLNRLSWKHVQVA